MPSSTFQHATLAQISVWLPGKCPVQIGPRILEGSQASEIGGIARRTQRGGGIVYPTVRHKVGVCIACFRPPLVLNVQEGPMMTFTFIDAVMSTAAVTD